MPKTTLEEKPCASYFIFLLYEISIFFPQIVLNLFVMIPNTDLKFMIIFINIIYFHFQTAQRTGNITFYLRDNGAGGAD